MHSASRVCSRLNTVTLSSVLTPHFAVHTHTFDKGSYLPLSLRQVQSWQAFSKLPFRNRTPAPTACETNGLDAPPAGAPRQLAQQTHGSSSRGRGAQQTHDGNLRTRQRHNAQAWSSMHSAFHTVATRCPQSCSVAGCRKQYAVGFYCPIHHKLLSSLLWFP